MIVIVSNELDRSTDHVIDWINYMHADYFRINKETKILSIQVNVSDSEQDFSVQFINGQKLFSSDISSYWYRKDGVSLQEYDENIFMGKKKRKLMSFIKAEGERTKKIIELIINEKLGIGAFEKHRTINKLEVLLAAKQIGFKIPQTLITNRKDVVTNQPLNTIIKAISEVFFHSKGRKCFVTYTSKFSDYILNDLPSFFVPSLFQNEIEKQYELRIFYLDKKCYGMAIFSQNDEKTSIDFRDYNYQKPNRWVPYRVDESFEEKIVQLMDSLRLDTGSLDFIVDKDDLIYFLEVNPSGQFGMVSYPCNYYLERKIANKLIYFHAERKIFNPK